MEWRNDVLSFSGFDYGVALKNNENKFDQLSEIQEISEDEISRKSENVERDKYLRTTYISSLSDEIAESTAIEPNLSIEENAKKEKANTKRLDFEAINERAVENLYFRNVEQAEKKLTMISQMRNKWRKGEMINRSQLKTTLQPNPWKFEDEMVTTIAKTSQNNNSYRCGCIIS